MNKPLLSFAAPAALLLTGSALAQDDCSTALPVAGFGGLAAGDTCVQTTSGFNGGGTCAAGASTINQDIFFQWVAPVSGIVVFDTFGSSYDTKLSIHAGVGCAAICAGYNDDSGGTLQSSIAACVTQGASYLIQLGGFGTNCGAYILNATPDTLCTGDDALEDNDTCATPTPMCDGTTAGLIVTKCDEDYYSITVNDGDTVVLDLTFTHANGDLDIFLYDAGGCALDEGVSGHGCANSLACGFSASDNEQIIYSNLTGAAQNLVFKVNVWALTGPNCNTYDLTITGSRCGGGGITIACDPANPHSQGGPTTLNNSSFGSGVGSDLHIDADNGPPGEFGYLLISAAITQPGLPVSNGILCLRPSIGRYAPNAGPGLNSVGNFNAAGTWETPANSGIAGWDVPLMLPNPPGGAIAAGDLWYFQLWYRDGLRSNFSNAICVTFP